MNNYTIASTSDRKPINFQRFITAAVILQLLVLVPANYFFFLPTSFVRWSIDSCLYIFALIIFLRLSVKAGVKLDKITFLYIALVMVNVASYIANDSGRLSMIKQVRFTFMGGTIYVLLLYGDLAEKFFKRLLKIIFFTGYVQLPLVVIQLLAYDVAYTRYSGPVADYVDYAGGSAENSGVLGTFLVMLAIVKIQKGIEYGFKPLTLIQLLLLLAPLGLINSDAQFFFLPLVIVFAIFINRKLTKRIFQVIAVSGIVFFAVNTLVFYNWEGSRSITGYITDYLNTRLFDTPDTSNNEQLLREDSMPYVWENDTKNPDIHILFGRGPGYWLGRDCNGNNPITNVWYRCNTALLMYGELGLGGLVIFLLLPLVIYIEADNSFWGKIVKIEAFYLFLSLFYHHPFNELTLAITSMTLIVYYRKFYMRKQVPVTIRQELPGKKPVRAVPESRRPVQVGVQTLQ